MPRRKSQQPEPITMELEEITPEIALKYLQTNVVNRKLQPNTVAFYARQMADGQWQLNGDAIRFSQTGALQDGQHRLTAVVESGRPLTTWVARGLPDEAQLTMDQQRKRTAGDMLAMTGMPRGNQVAAIVRVIRRWDQGERSIRGFAGGQRPMSMAEVIHAATEDPLFLEAAQRVSARGLYGQAPPRALGALYVLLARTHVQLSDVFFEYLTSGADLPEGNPILTLRRYWANLGGSNTRHGGANSALYLMAGVRAWNAWAEGRKLAQIAYKSTEIPEVVVPSPRLRRAGSSNILNESDQNVLQET
jgi:hypothetical protein